MPCFDSALVHKRPRKRLLFLKTQTGDKHRMPITREQVVETKSEIPAITHSVIRKNTRGKFKDIFCGRPSLALVCFRLNALDDY